MEDLFIREGAPLLGAGMLISLDLIPEAGMVDFIIRCMAAGGKLCSEAVAARLLRRPLAVNESPSPSMVSRWPC